MSLNTNTYYRLTNKSLGNNLALDVKPDGTGYLMIARSADVSGQYWRLAPKGQGKYALQTWYLGSSFSLDIVNDAQDNTPILAGTANYTGQSWSLTATGSGTYFLTNDFTGPNKKLSVTSSSNPNPIMATDTSSAQEWTLQPLIQVPDYPDIPQLNNTVSVYNPESATNFADYKKPSGKVNAVMIFVDFSDAPASSTNAQSTADHLLGGKKSGETQYKAEKLFAEQSYSLMSLQVDIKSSLGWKRMPKPATDYSFATHDSHKAYVTAATELFTEAQVTFSNYDFVYVVAPPNAPFPISPTLICPPDGKVITPSGQIQWGVTFGQDSYKNRYINLVHETGHILGLPDLYPYGGGTNYVGCWGLMSDIFHSVSFLGWHRHKNLWLTGDRTLYIKQNTPHWYVTVNPLSIDCGTSLIALPIDGLQKPTKMFVIEVAEPVLGTTDKYWGDGILLYTVDGNIATGQSPIQIKPKESGTSPEYGDLYKAPYQTGDTKTITEGKATITLKVLEKFQHSYNISIAYNFLP